MKKTNTILFIISGLLNMTTFSALAQSKAKLEIVSSFPVERPSNIAVSPEGRIFITVSPEGETRQLVKEIMPDGKVRNFPDTAWTKKPQGASFKGISSAIGIQISSDNVLWVLDMGNKEVQPQQSPKLIAWDIKSGTLRHVFILPDAVLRPSSFTQDFAIDEKHEVAVIADMTMGGMVLPALPAFIVVDLKTGYSRRVLENHESFKPLDEPVIVNGRPVSHKYPDGRIYEPKYPLNPIAIDKKMEWIYYGALGGNKIYRISAAAIADEKLTAKELSASIKYYADKPKSDGFKPGNNGQLYVTDVEHNAIGIASPKGYELLVQDNDLISWPDGLALSADGYLYIVSNQLHNKAWWNNGENVSKPPYYVLRIKVKL